jgi:CRISPR-associated protein Cmr4
MLTRILYIFTRTPLHVGAGASVGAIDQPIVRERHTGFPVIPATSLKGTFSDAWNDGLFEQNGNRHLRVTTRKADGSDKEELDAISEAAWLFGSDNANHAFAGALQFSEARLLAFPIRSARGSFAWITCPLLLQRAVRDGLFAGDIVAELFEPSDEAAIFDTSSQSKLAIQGKIVLEEYAFQAAEWNGLSKVGEAFRGVLLDDLVWSEVSARLVIMSNGMMSFFARNACEIAQHIRINDDTGTVAQGALFNQENVPGECLFYAMVHVLDERTPQKIMERRPATAAWETFKAKVSDFAVFQFGGDASTGLGYCTVKAVE